MSISEIITDNPRRELVANIPRSEYRKMAGLNPSSLASGLMSDWDVDPRSIRDAYEGVELVRTAATQDRMDRGSLAHLALLQPERLVSDLAVWHGGRRSGLDWHKFEDENKDRLVVTAADFSSTMESVNKLRSVPIVAELLCDIEPEVAVFSGLNIDGLTIQVRGQVDAVRRADILRIVDIKTTEAGIDQKSCERTATQFYYREKMAMYRDWVAAETQTDPEEWRCYNLFLSLGDRPGVRAMQFTTASLEWGRYRMQKALASVAECLRSKAWPVFAKSDFIDVKPWEIENEPDEEIDYGNG